MRSTPASASVPSGQRWASPTTSTAGPSRGVAGAGTPLRRPSPRRGRCASLPGILRRPGWRPAGPATLWAAVRPGPPRAACHLVLEAGKAHPVAAQVAVHPDVAERGLPEALDDQVGQPGVGTERRTVTHHEVGVVLGPGLHSVGDALHQHAGEQEQRDDGDPAGPEPAAPLEGVLDRGAASSPRTPTRPVRSRGRRRAGGRTSPARRRRRGRSSRGRRGRPRWDPFPVGGRRWWLGPAARRRRAPPGGSRGRGPGGTARLDGGAGRGPARPGRRPSGDRRRTARRARPRRRWHPPRRARRRSGRWAVRPARGSHRGSADRRAAVRAARPAPRTRWPPRGRGFRGR